MESDKTIEIVKCYMNIANSYRVQDPTTLELVSDDVYWLDPRFPPFRGKEQVAQYFQYAGIENMLMRVLWQARNIFAQGEEACVEWYAEATLGIKFSIEGSSVFKVRDGKIYYYRGYWDTFLWKSPLTFPLSKSLLNTIAKVGFKAYK
jgi:limonene-1,2-epoxide hydrolase